MNNSPKRVMFELAKKLGNKYRISRGGVPHIVGEIHGKTASICYFKKTNTFRVFTPYPSYDQDKFTFKTEERLLEFINKKDA